MLGIDGPCWAKTMQPNGRIVSRNPLDAPPRTPGAAMSEASMTKEQLIQALENATEGSRELDGAIAEAFGLPPFGMVMMGKGHGFTYPSNNGFASAVQYHPPEFSRSLDAAMTLVPEGMGWLIGRGQLFDSEPPYGASICHMRDPDKVYGAAESTSAPLALCIAALRARPA